MELRSPVAGRWYPLPPIWLEGRAWLEYGQLLCSPIFGGEGVPPGDGRTIMLIPGFLAGDATLDTLSAWLRRNGYQTLRSGINVNVQSSEILLQRIASRLSDEYRQNGHRMTLVGQSRGGVLALGVAQRFPKLVDQVITLGSPIGDPLDVHPTTMAAIQMARFVHMLWRGPGDLDARFDRELPEPVGVPFTSLYSKTDGIVSWQACLRPDVESVEVGGSHVGMGVNARVYQELAQLLARPPQSVRRRG
jgi:pimeloyl-ACP methyl ester carboxylesterase